MKAIIKLGLTNDLVVIDDKVVIGILPLGDDVLNEANAFYMTSSPETTFDLNMQSEIVNAGCHQSTVKALVLKK